MLTPKGIAWVGLYAEDIERLGSYYAAVVGLDLIEGDGSYKIFSAGGGALFEIRSRGSARERKTPSEQSMVVGFLVDQLEPAVQMLKERGLAADTSIESYLGTRRIYCTDPEGNRFDLKDSRG